MIVLMLQKLWFDSIDTPIITEPDWNRLERGGAGRPDFHGACTRYYC
jgi:hypothetical protein